MVPLTSSVMEAMPERTTESGNQSKRSFVARSLLVLQSGQEQKLRSLAVAPSLKKAQSAAKRERERERALDLSVLNVLAWWRRVEPQRPLRFFTGRDANHLGV